MNMIYVSFIFCFVFRSADQFLPNHPCVIAINSYHNHRIKSAAALSFRPPNQEIKDKFIELFKSGHSATQALEAHKRNLMDEYEDNYYLVCADRAICPDVKWAHYLYKTAFEAEFGPSTGQAMVEHLQKTVSEYNADGNTAVMRHIGSDIIIAVCSAFMKRIHGLPNASQICFLDSSGNMDRFNCRVFLLMVDTVVGGLPIGVLITTSESEAVITAALGEYKKILPEDAFGDNRQNGPSVFMTDNAAALRNSLATNFPASTCLLCIFHVLQAAWRWLWDAKHGIRMDHRQECFGYISQMLYCLTEVECAEAYSKALSSAVVQKYDGFAKYLSDLYDDRQSWALYSRQELPTRGNNTNNMVESAFRVLKDKVLERTRAYSVPQLFSFVTDSIDRYFSSKILTNISGKNDQRSRYKPSSTKATETFEITEGNNGLYEVFNPVSGQTYSTHLAVGICSCPVGLTGGPCKHQHAVSVKYKLEGHNSVLLSAETKVRLHYVATGSRDVPNDWYGSLVYTSPQKARCHGPAIASNTDVNNKPNLSTGRPL